MESTLFVLAGNTELGKVLELVSKQHKGKIVLDQEIGIQKVSENLNLTLEDTSHSPEPKTLVVTTLEKAKTFEHLSSAFALVYSVKKPHGNYFKPPDEFALTSVSKTFKAEDSTFSILGYTSRNCSLPLEFGKHEEYQYLETIKEVIQNGTLKDDRTNIGTYSLFGKMMRFDLKESFPLLTTKRVFWKGVVEELLWFIRGSTNAKELSEKGVRIWEGNGSREFLDSLGLSHREEGDLGPVYGFQWRHFGASYTDMHSNYEGQGVDQLMDVIHQIKTNPNSRRIVMCAWNPASQSEMALPPCHVLAQFYVENGFLSCMMYQRSCDLGLGVPFNIASYSLLTCLISQVCNLMPGEFIHVMGDSHVYQNHLEPLTEQLGRTPNPFPSLKLNSQVKDITKFTFEDIQLENYNPCPRIPMQMAV